MPDVIAMAITGLAGISVVALQTPPMVAESPPKILNLIRVNVFGSSSVGSEYKGKEYLFVPTFMYFCTFREDTRNNQPCDISSRRRMIIDSNNGFRLPDYKKSKATSWPILSAKRRRKAIA